MQEMAMSIGLLYQTGGLSCYHISLKRKHVKSLFFTGQQGTIVLYGTGHSKFEQCSVTPGQHAYLMDWSRFYTGTSGFCQSYSALSPLDKGYFLQ